MGLTIEEAKKNLSILLEKYQTYIKNNEFVRNEKQICASLIVPFFNKVLGWDTEDPSEFKVEYSQGGKRIDYLVCLDGISQFIVEAKALSHNISDNFDYFKQARDYAHTKYKSFAILTNFKQLIILRADIEVDNPLKAVIKEIDLTDLKDGDFELIWNFQKSVWVEKGSENELYKMLNLKRRKKIDEELLDDFQKWRSALLTNLRKFPRLNKLNFDNEKELMYVEEEVQRYIDRLIFIASCEDRELVEPELRFLLNDKKDRWSGKEFLVWEIPKLFEKYRKTYNSDLFEIGLCDKFCLEDFVLNGILLDLREPRGRLPYDFKVIEADILGKTYETFIGHLLSGKKRFSEKESKGKRRSGGIYYTPSYIVEFIVNSTLRIYLRGKTFEEINKVRILDPACGSGSFLLKAYDVLIEEGQKQLKRPLTYEEKEGLVLNCIYGVDKDERACDIAKLNISLKLAEKHKKLPPLNSNIKNGDSLIESEAVIGYKAFVWEEKFKQIMHDGGFDIILGNPPWVSIKGKQKSVDLSENELNYLFEKYPCDRYRPNLFEMFIWRSLSLLKKEGYFGFIVPDRLCYNGQFTNLRKHIIKDYNLKKLWFRPFFEGVISDNVIFILEKQKSANNSIVEISQYPSINFQKLPQKLYSNLSDSSWFIIDEKILKIFERIREKRGVFELSEKFQSSVGFIAKEDKITESRQNKNQIKVLKGENIGRFEISGNFYFEFKKNNLAGGTQDEEKLSKKFKVFLRKTGADIIAAFNDTLAYPEQSVYFIYTEADKEQDKLKVLCAILNSKLLNCYYKNFAVTNRDATPQLKKVDLDKFPIILPEISKQLLQLIDKMFSLNKRIGELGDKEHQEVKQIKEQIEKSDAEIDKFVYELYGLTDSEIKLIEESLK